MWSEFGNVGCLLFSTASHFSWSTFITEDMRLLLICHTPESPEVIQDEVLLTTESIMKYMIFSQLSKFILLTIMALTISLSFFRSAFIALFLETPACCMTNSMSFSSMPVASTSSSSDSSFSIGCGFVSATVLTGSGALNFSAACKIQKHIKRLTSRNYTQNITRVLEVNIQTSASVGSVFCDKKTYQNVTYISFACS